MAFRLFLPLFLIFFLFLFIAVLNPGMVEFHYAPGRSVSLPYVALVMFSFLAGTLSLTLVYFFKGVGDLSNDFANAVRRWRAARIEGNLLKARAKAGLGRLDAALRMAERILFHKPEHFGAFMLKGEVLRRMGRPQEALMAHSMALSLDPANLEAIVQIKEDYKALGNRDAAYRLLEQARGRAPHDAAILAEMRDLSVMAGEFHRAAVLQRDLLPLAPDEVARAAELVKTAEIHCLYAEQLLAEGKYGHARETLEFALKVEPDFTAAAMLLADTLWRLSLRHEARAALKKQFDRTRSPVALLKLAALHDGSRADLFARACESAPDENLFRLFLIAEKIVARDLPGAAQAVADPSDALAGYPLFGIAKRIVEISASGNPDADAVGALMRSLREEMETLVAYQCAACGAVEGRYFTQCPTCTRWNTATVAVRGKATPVSPA